MKLKKPVFWPTQIKLKIYEHVAEAMRNKVAVHENSVKPVFKPVFEFFPIFAP